MSIMYRKRRLEKLTNSVVLVLEPLDRVGGSDLVRGSDLSVLVLSDGDSGTRSSHTAVEVHTVDTDGRVVLDVQVNVLLDTESEVSGRREVGFLQFVFPDFQSSLENLLGLWSSDRDVHGDLLVTPDSEGSDCVSGFRVDWSLTGQLLQNLGSSGQPVTRLSDTDVKNQLLDLQIPHGVVRFGFGHGINLWRLSDGCS